MLLYEKIEALVLLLKVSITVRNWRGKEQIIFILFYWLAYIH